MATNVQGTVYLLHFNKKVAGHAQHYMGWALAGRLFARLSQHESGNGQSSPLVRALIHNGGEFELVRTWKGDRYLERELKNRKNASKLCPVCRKEHD